MHALIKNIKLKGDEPQNRFVTFGEKVDFLVSNILVLSWKVAFWKKQGLRFSSNHYFLRKVFGLRSLTTFWKQASK